MVPMHYVWSGPKTDKSHRLPGMDTVGPYLTKQAYPEQEIHIWCWDSEVEKFVNDIEDTFGSFQDSPTIHVHGMESFIKKVDDTTYLGFIKTLQARATAFKAKAEALEKGNKNHEEIAKNLIRVVQEYIVIKESFFYFAMQYVGKGYPELPGRKAVFLDTDIQPDKGAPVIKLEEFSGVTVPSVMVDVDNRKREEFPDPWLMYGDETDIKATERYNQYMAITWPIIEAKTDGEAMIPQDSDKQTITNAFAICVKGAALVRATEVSECLQTFQGLSKRYLNTHRTAAEGSQGSKGSPLFSYLEHPNPMEIAHFIKAGGIDPANDILEKHDSVGDLTYCSLIQYVMAGLIKSSKGYDSLIALKEGANKSITATMSDFSKERVKEENSEDFKESSNDYDARKKWGEYLTKFYEDAPSWGVNLDDPINRGHSFRLMKENALIKEIVGESKNRDDFQGFWSKRYDMFGFHLEVWCTSDGNIAKAESEFEHVVALLPVLLSACEPEYSQAVLALFNCCMKASGIPMSGVGTLDELCDMNITSPNRVARVEILDFVIKTIVPGDPLSQANIDAYQAVFKAKYLSTQSEPEQGTEFFKTASPNPMDEIFTKQFSDALEAAASKKSKITT